MDILTSGVALSLALRKEGDTSADRNEGRWRGMDSPHPHKKEAEERKRGQTEDERKGEGARKMRARAEHSEGASAGDDAADRPWRRARRSVWNNSTTPFPPPYVQAPPTCPLTQSLSLTL